MNPGVPQVPQVPGSMWQGVTPGYNQQLAPNTPYENTNTVAGQNPYGSYSHDARQAYEQFLVGNLYHPERWADNIKKTVPPGLLRDAMLGLVSQSSASPSSAFVNPSQVGNQNSLVGQNISSAMIPDSQMNQLFPNVSEEEKKALMVSKGYRQAYQPGIGVMWLKVDNSAGTQQLAQAATDARGRYYDVAGENLAPGERVIGTNGVRYVGGTPTENGTGQYAITLPNQAAAKDTHGRYKWVSTVQQDARGNWVRVYRQQLRKVYTRSHLKNQAANNSGGNQGPSASGNATNEATQLVNFRANYG